MSHSVVIVVGDDVEGQLAPFDENKEVEPYHEPYPREKLARMLKFYAEEQKPEKVDERLRSIARKAGISAEGKVVGISHSQLASLTVPWCSERLELLKEPLDGCWYTIVNTYNPKSKWDWYEIGGRWTGYFKLKKGHHGLTGKPGLQTSAAKPGYADQCRKIDIDIEAMQHEAAAEAEKRYDVAHRLLKHRPFTLWEGILAMYPEPQSEEDLEKARKQYREQPAIADFYRDRDNAFSDPDQFAVSREEYVQSARDEALAPFALLKDGEWHERGEMGWWGCVSNEIPRSEWAKQFMKLFDELPDNTLLTAVDVHI